MIEPSTIRILGEILDIVCTKTDKLLPIIHPITVEHQKEYLELILKHQNDILAINKYEYNTSDDTYGLYVIYMNGTSEIGYRPILHLDGYGRRFVFEILDEESRKRMDEALGVHKASEPVPNEKTSESSTTEKR